MRQAVEMVQKHINTSGPCIKAFENCEKRTLENLAAAWRKHPNNSSPYLTRLYLFVGDISSRLQPDWITRNQPPATATKTIAAFSALVITPDTYGTPRHAPNVTQIVSLLVNGPTHPTPKETDCTYAFGLCSELPSVHTFASEELATIPGNVSPISTPRTTAERHNESQESAGTVGHQVDTEDLNDSPSPSPDTVLRALKASVDLCEHHAGLASLRYDAGQELLNSFETRVTMYVTQIKDCKEPVKRDLTRLDFNTYLKGPVETYGLLSSPRIPTGCLKLFATIPEGV